MSQRQKLYHIIKVSPKRLAPDQVPESFLNDLKKKSRYQGETFNILAFPLSIKDYKLYSLRKYSRNSVIKFFNENLVPIRTDLTYIMKYPLLVKGIIDTLFELSGSELEQFNYNPDKMFQLLKERRRELGSFDALMDNFVLANMGINEYMQYRKLESLEDRLAIVSVLESYFGVIIEERYALSKKIKRPIKLVPDKSFSKEYERIMNSESGQELGFADISKALESRMQEDKKLSEYGIKRTVRTADENREMATVDGVAPDGKPLSGSGLPSNLD